VIRKNPPAGFLPVAALPGNPRAGQSVFHTGAGAGYLWDGARWVGVNGVSALYSPGVGVVIRDPVVIVDGDAIRCLAASHAHADGVVSAIVDSFVEVRRVGPVFGFADLVVGQVCLVGAAGGVTQTPIPVGNNIITLGVAQSATVLAAHVSEGTGT